MLPQPTGKMCVFRGKAPPDSVSFRHPIPDDSAMGIRGNPTDLTPIKRVDYTHQCDPRTIRTKLPVMTEEWESKTLPFTVRFLYT